jgi:hypothetical protein
MIKLIPHPALLFYEQIAPRLLPSWLMARPEQLSADPPILKESLRLAYR